MKQVAYNLELACFGFIAPAAVVVVVGVRLFFKAPASDVVMLTSLILVIQSFVAFKSSPLPSGIVPKRFGIALKLATVFISNGIGNDKFCGTNGSLFKWSCCSTESARSFEEDLKFSAILSILRVSVSLDFRPFVSMFKNVFELPFSSKGIDSWVFCSNWFSRHWFWYRENSSAPRLIAVGERFNGFANIDGQSWNVFANILSNGNENFVGELAIDEFAIGGGGDGDAGDTAVGGGVCDCFVVDSLSVDWFFYAKEDTRFFMWLLKFWMKQRIFFSNKNLWEFSTFLKKLDEIQKCRKIFEKFAEKYLLHWYRPVLLFPKFRPTITKLRFAPRKHSLHPNTWKSTVQRSSQMKHQESQSPKK